MHTPREQGVHRLRCLALTCLLASLLQGSQLSSTTSRRVCSHNKIVWQQWLCTESASRACFSERQQMALAMPGQSCQAEAAPIKFGCSITGRVHYLELGSRCWGALHSRSLK